MPEADIWGGFREGPREREWLYRHGGSLYGPISTKVLIDKIRQGQVPSDVAVAPDGADDFQPIGELAEFKVEVDKAVAHLRLAQEREAQRKRAKVRRTVTGAVSVAVVLALAGGGYVATQWYLHRSPPTARSAAVVVEAVAPPAPEPPPDVLGEPKVELDLDLLPLVSVKKKVPKKGGKKGSMTDEGPQGCQLDQLQMMTSIRSSFGQIKGCAKDEMRRTKSLPGALIISFTVANDGKVVTFETDSREVRSGPYFDCLKRTFTGLRFPKFAGERCNIDYPISFGGKK